MDPTVWGPHYWMFLHTVAAHYPKHPDAITKKIHYRLFHNFNEFIPHRQIAANFRKLLELYPITPYLDSRARLVEWVNFIHNKVNGLLGKPEVSLSEHRENMRELYFNKSKRWDRYAKNNFLVISFMFIVMLFAVVYVYAS
jgi:FAD-linked sulfhydryl oxidase